MIEISHISKRFGQVLALDDLTLRVDQGKILGLLGKNGAGKSTLMSIIVGCQRQDAGNVSINGKDLQKDPLSAKREFSYLPENVPVYPEFTVVENLRLAARLNGVQASRISTMVAEAMKCFELTDLRNRLVGTMSKGQRQRVGLAQTIVCTPAKIMILDEPTSGLDPNQIMQFRELIKDMRGEHTIILSSHILADVKDVCDDIAVIDNGRLIVHGEVDSLIEKYASFRKLELLVESGSSTLLELLRLHPDVTKAEVIGMTAGGDSRIIIDATRDIRSEVFKMAIQANAVLLSMNAPDSTLDNIFTRLTQQVRSADENAL